MEQLDIKKIRRKYDFWREAMRNDAPDHYVDGLWDDLVNQDDTLEQLLSLCERLTETGEAKRLAYIQKCYREFADYESDLRAAIFYGTLEERGVATPESPKGFDAIPWTSGPSEELRMCGTCTAKHSSKGNSYCGYNCHKPEEPESR